MKTVNQGKEKRRRTPFPLLPIPRNQKNTFKAPIQHRLNSPGGAARGGAGGGGGAPGGPKRSGQKVLVACNGGSNKFLSDQKESGGGVMKV